MGLLIEAALRPAATEVVHGADTPELVDVTDLGRLLYASLVCRWPGGPAFGLSSAPTMGRRWMTPRQVRAGVSPALDNVCDQILGDPPRHHAAAITTAGGIVTALTKVLGSADAAPDLERRLHQPIPTVTGGTRTTDPAANVQPVSSLLDQTTASTGGDIGPGRFRRPAPHPPLNTHACQLAGLRQDRTASEPPRTKPPAPAPRYPAAQEALDRLAAGARGAADRGGNHLRHRCWTGVYPEHPNRTHQAINLARLSARRHS